MKKRILNISKLDNIDYFKTSFLEETKKIINIPKMPKCDFLHIGSTSYSNTYGESIIDILIVVENLHEITTFDEKRLNNINYHRISHNEKGIIKYARITDYHTLNYDVILYIVQKHTNIYNSYISFNNLLRNNGTVLEKYNNLKQKYYNKDSYKEYSQEKKLFINNILKKEYLYD